ncbi:MAG: hypothetical protein LBP38_06790 [Desulfovibrio sp.]|nr:hypothetical protein [Desulfovibrio sp.]
MRTLVFGPMPEGATPATHIAAGAWCFVGREALFPNWDGPSAGNAPSGSCPERSEGNRAGHDVPAASDSGYFPLPPDPYPDAAAAATAAATANAEVLRLCRTFASRFPGRSERFYLTALGPTLLTAAHMTEERQQRLLDLAALYGNQRLRVDMLPEGDFSFRDSLDFMVRGVQDPLFNHYLYSRMLEHSAPPAWELHSLPPAPALPRADTAIREPLRARLRACLRRILLRLPFPPLKGFGLTGALLLSAAALLNRGQQDATLDFSLYCTPPAQPHPPRHFPDNPGQSVGAPLPSLRRFPADDFIMRCLPPALLREVSRPRAPCFARLRGKRAERPPARSPLRGISPAYAQDDVYRLYTARSAERGARLFSVQHGANYGNLFSIGGLPFEYSLHAFLTWGWSAHPGHAVNARPMPHPALVAAAGRHKEQSPCLILVGTEMSAFAYRLKSRPQSGALPSYRAAKIRFLGTVRAGLASSPAAVVMYRPYFRSAGALDDGERVFRLLPDITPCTGDLTAHIHACRLLVLDHYGTTLHCALAADTPTVAFWKRADWGMDAQSSAALDILARAGILHETPEAAAAQTLAVWDNINDWWHSPPVQKARRIWLDRYAWIAVPGDGELRSSPRSLLWYWFKMLMKI